MEGWKEESFRERSWWENEGWEEGKEGEGEISKAKELSQNNKCSSKNKFSALKHSFENPFPFLSFHICVNSPSSYSPTPPLQSLLNLWRLSSFFLDVLMTGKSNFYFWKGFRFYLIFFLLLELFFQKTNLGFSLYFTSTRLY